MLSILIVLLRDVLAVNVRVRELVLMSSGYDMNFRGHCGC